MTTQQVPTFLLWLGGGVLGIGLLVRLTLGKTRQSPGAGIVWIIAGIIMAILGVVMPYL